MVVNSRSVDPAQLDVPYCGLFLGLHVNRLVADGMRAAGFEGVRESHGYLIQHLIGHERTISELARRMEVSQQAASKTVAELARLRVVEFASSGDRRSKTVRLSARGWKMVESSRRMRRRIEGRLIGVSGREQYETARAILAQYLEALGGLDAIRSRRVRQPM